MPQFIPVPGTWAWKKGQWWEEGSAWTQYMKEQGAVIANPARPFVWTTELSGLFGKGDWEAAGENLFAYVVPPLGSSLLKPQDTNIIAHSHGLQVVLYACAKGMKINTLFTIGSPIRKDMQEVAKLARPNIRYWEHFYSDKSDKWQWMGELFDGKFGIVREAKYPNGICADAQSFLKGVGHSEILNKPEHFGVWNNVISRMETHL